MRRLINSRTPALLPFLGTTLWASAQDAPQVSAPTGFKVELIYAAPPEEGSWISMAFDPKGRIIVSAEKGGLRRIVPPQGDQGVKLEPLAAAITGAHGLCWAFDALYANGTGPEGLGLYRLPDKDGEQPGDPILLRKWEGAGEHGPHAVVAGPDKKLYVVNGCLVKIPEGVLETSPYSHYQEDQLLPPIYDPGSPASNAKIPAGHVLRTDAEGRNWELWCGGLYNPYDLAFNADGEAFTFDGDNEADLGSPWYAPAQVFHVVSGGEYGWRPGSGRLPVWYHDRLPAAADAGRAAPAGLTFGTKAKFPQKYRAALFAGDWANGRILAVHLKPTGGTYAGTVETFVSGNPLPVTDVEVGPDGALYFITGGRGAPGRLYKVTFPDQPQGEAAAPRDLDAAAARRLRRKLEEMQRARKTPEIPPDASRERRRELEKEFDQEVRERVDTLWPHLSHEDRFVRFAARVALEHQDVKHWARQATLELKEQSAYNAFLALTRAGGAPYKEVILKDMQRYPWSIIETEEFRLACLRTYGVVFCRLGPPPESMMPFLFQRFDGIYPDPESDPLNRELCRILVYMKSQEVAAKTLGLIKKAKSQEEELHYGMLLRTLKEGWTPDLRKEYFAWLGKAAGFKEGPSLAACVARARADALSTLAQEERGRFEK